MAPTKQKKRRSPEERIADLQAEIARLKARAAHAKAKKDPALRHISGAVRALDKATAETRDKATREAVAEARATLAACLSLNGAVPATPGTTRSRAAGPRPDPGRILDYVRKNPGARSEEMCAELGTDAATLRPVLHELRDEGKLKVQGKARATRYSAKA